MKIDQALDSQEHRHSRQDRSAKHCRYLCRKFFSLYTV